MQVPAVLHPHTPGLWAPSHPHSAPHLTPPPPSPPPTPHLPLAHLGDEVEDPELDELGLVLLRAHVRMYACAYVWVGGMGG